MHLCDADGGGEWFGYLRRDNTVFNRCKGGNYKGFFHVPRGSCSPFNLPNAISLGTQHPWH